MDRRQLHSVSGGAFDVFQGADLWPLRGDQPMFKNTSWILDCFDAGDPARPLVSIGLFATNLTYNSGLTGFDRDAGRYRTFYDTEARMFAGDDLNAAAVDTAGWKGLGHYIPVRTVVTQLPFETSFNTGQGRIMAADGVQVARPWTDISKQSILPSWQWAKTGSAAVSVRFDFERAFVGGSSLLLEGRLDNDQAVIRLYQTKVQLPPRTRLDVTYAAGATGDTRLQVLAYFADDLANPVPLPLGVAASTGWTTTTLDLSAHVGRELAVLGLRVAADTVIDDYRLSVGRLRLYGGEQR